MTWLLVPTVILLCVAAWLWMRAHERAEAALMALDAARAHVEALRAEVDMLRPKPLSSVDDAVKAAMLTVGLNTDAYSHAVDLASTGKVQDVLHHAAAALGRDLPLRTVGDVVTYLERLEA